MEGFYLSDLDVECNGESDITQWIPMIKGKATINGILDEDLFSELMLHIIEKEDKYNSKWSYGTWIGTLCNNYISSKIRNNEKKLDGDCLSLDYENEEGNEFKEVIATDENGLDLESKDITYKVLNKLDERSRRILELHYIEGYKLKEISNFYDISHERTRQVIRKAENTVKKFLEWGGIKKYELI